MLARVFPTKTKASPIDNYVFFDKPPMIGLPEDIKEVHISVVFKWDLKYAEYLAKEWEKIAPVKIGGPAFDNPENEFITGRYVKKGYVITSRGCTNRCWFCSVWKRNPEIKELEIQDGWNVLDDNLLACSKEHQLKVFGMLCQQKERVQFTGGLEAKRFTSWHLKQFNKLRIAQMFFAYDTPDDYEPLRIASRLLRNADYNRHKMRCYVLIGYPKDTFDAAEKRLWDVVNLGFYPMAMLYRDNNGSRNLAWMKFQKGWARPAAIYAKIKQKETQ